MSDERGNLILKLKPGSSAEIIEGNITVDLIRIVGGVAHVGFRAPRSTRIVRGNLLDRIISAGRTFTPRQELAPTG